VRGLSETSARQRSDRVRLSMPERPLIRRPEFTLGPALPDPGGRHLLPQGEKDSKLQVEQPSIPAFAVAVDLALQIGRALEAQAFQQLFGAGVAHLGAGDDVL